MMQDRGVQCPRTTREGWKFLWCLERLRVEEPFALLPRLGAGWGSACGLASLPCPGWFPQGAWRPRTVRWRPGTGARLPARPSPAGSRAPGPGARRNREVGSWWSLGSLWGLAVVPSAVQDSVDGAFGVGVSQPVQELGDRAAGVAAVPA